MCRDAKQWRHIVEQCFFGFVYQTYMCEGIAQCMRCDGVYEGTMQVMNVYADNYGDVS